MLSTPSSLNIYAAILTQIKNGTPNPTKIIYADTQSLMTLKKILENLTAQGFIEEQLEEDNKTKNNYTITNKGNNALNYLNNINDLMNPDLGQTISTL